MAAFGHVLTLISFVFAVSLAQILLRVSALVAARDKVKYSGLSGLAMANGILLVYANWLAMWEVRGVGDWNLLSITVTFLFALSVCFICTLAAPQLGSDEATDMNAFYWKQRKPYYGAWLVCEVLAILANTLFTNSPMASKLGAESLVNLTLFAPILLAFFVPKRWAQWTAGIVLFALNATFLVVFERQLG